MREILFRGKRANNRGWAEGLLFHHCEKSSSMWSDELDRAVWVAPETVGQFTGLTDKNGKRIFDGDIIYNGYGAYGAVEWAYGAFVVRFPDGDQWDICQYVNEEYTKVIGNIHDNPELLSDSE